MRTDQPEPDESPDVRPLASPDDVPARPHPAATPASRAEQLAEHHRYRVVVGASDQGTSHQVAGAPSPSDKTRSDQGTSDKETSARDKSDPAASADDTGNQAAGDQAAGDQAAGDQAARDPGTSDRGATDQAASDRGTRDRATSDRAASDQGAGHAAATGGDPGHKTTGDHVTWAEALPGLRAAWLEHKARYPEQARAVPRTEADGSWSCGQHRRLDPEQNTEAGKVHADLADEADGHILPALRRIEAADPERKLAGLNHMIKGEDRLKEKLADELIGKQKTVREAISEVPDAVRFTLRYDCQRYAEGVQADVQRLKEEGFVLIKLKNLWTDEQYKGINSQWRTPDTGTRFEMQFHTPESLAAKELTHAAYARIRSVDATPAERHDARAFQRHVNEFLSTPPETDHIKDYPEKNNA